MGLEQRSPGRSASNWCISCYMTHVWYYNGKCINVCIIVYLYYIIYKVKVYFYISCLNYNTCYKFISYSHKSGGLRGLKISAPSVLTWRCRPWHPEDSSTQSGSRARAPQWSNPPLHGAPFAHQRAHVGEAQGLGKFENSPLLIFKMIRIDIKCTSSIKSKQLNGSMRRGVMAFTFWSSTGTSSLALLPSLTGKAKGLRLQLALWTMIRHSIARSSRKNNSHILLTLPVVWRFGNGRCRKHPPEEFQLRRSTAKTSW